MTTRPQRPCLRSTLPRFGVLPLAPDGRAPCYVIYDRLTQRITNGVYRVLDMALANAASAEEYGADVANMTPDAEGLGLLFPDLRTEKGEAVIAIPDFFIEPDEIEPERPARSSPVHLVSGGLHPTAEAPTSRLKDRPPVYVPCEACGGMVKPCHDLLYISGAFRRLYPVGTNAKSMSCWTENARRAERLSAWGR